MSHHVVQVPMVPRLIPGTELTLHQVPSATDNLIWLLSSSDGSAFAVDGPSVKEVDLYCEAQGLTLVGVLNTHIHGDHIGINHALQKSDRLKELMVVGAKKTADAIPGLTHPVEDGDSLEILSTRVEVMLTEGHINGHISYLVGGALFCGDTLFGGGCGYLFDGPPRTMHESLQRLAALPPETLVCCAHEYTQDNMAFAWWVGAENDALISRIRDVHERRRKGATTLPSTIGLERQTNPFIRVGDEAVTAACSKHAGREVDPGAATFALLRGMKDQKKYREDPRPGYPAEP